MNFKAAIFKNRHARLSALIIAVASSLVLTTFQNCGKAGFESTGQENLELMQQEIQSDVTPFAFEAAVDQISYLSCASPTSTSKAFTFKAGAYGVTSGGMVSPDIVQSGVRIKKSYVDWAKINVKPAYDPNNPANAIATATDAKLFLAGSKRNEKAQAQFSMRMISDLTRIYTTQTTALYGIDIVPMMGMLTDDRWLSPLFLQSDFSSQNSIPKYINFSPLGDDELRAMEGSLQFNTNEENAQDIRYQFYNSQSGNGQSAMLVLGYDDNIDQNILRTSVPGDKRRAFGLGYKLLFDIYSDGTNTIAGTATRTSPENVLVDIAEVNLETGAASGRTWSCQPYRRYMIVRKADADANPNLCPKDKFSDFNNSNLNIKQEYEIVRRHFPAKDYEISITGQCIIPLNFSCYRDEVLNNIAVNVEYDPTRPCFYGTAENLSQFPQNSRPINYCPEYASICIRN